MMHIVYNKDNLGQFLVFSDDNKINSGMIFKKTFKIENGEVIGVLQVEDFNVAQSSISLCEEQGRVEVKVEKVEEIESSDYVSPEVKIESLRSEIEGLQLAIAELTILLAGGET